MATFPALPIIIDFQKTSLARVPEWLAFLLVFVSLVTSVRNNRPGKKLQGELFRNAKSSENAKHAKVMLT